jgi:hypothetical protein
VIQRTRANRMVLSGGLSKFGHYIESATINKFRLPSSVATLQHQGGECVRPPQFIANGASRIAAAVAAFLIFWGKLYYPFGDPQRRR